MPKIIFLIVFPFFLISVDGHARTRKGRCTNLIGKLVGAVDWLKVKIGLFNTGRGLGDYVNNFGPEFIDDLTELNGDGVIVELGAGQCKFARQLLITEEFTTSGFTIGIEQETEPSIYPVLEAQVPSHKFYGIGLEVLQKLEIFSRQKAKPQYFGITRNRPAKLSDSEKFTILEGDFENSDDVDFQARLNAVPKADVVVDVYGIITYSRDLASTLQFILNKLKVNGSAYIQHNEKVLHIFVGGKLMSLVQFLQTVPGIDVQQLVFELTESSEPFKMVPNGNQKSKLVVGGFRITKNIDSVVIPHLTLKLGLPTPQGESIKAYFTP